MREYPLYETTYFSNFRGMMDSAAKKFPARTAFSYKEDPHKEVVSRITFSEFREEARHFGTALIGLGCRERCCAIVGATSIGWILSYFTLMAIGAVTVPCDKELSVEDLAANISKAECPFVFYSSDVSAKVEKLKEALDLYDTANE